MSTAALTGILALLGCALLAACPAESHRVERSAQPTSPRDVDNALSAPAHVGDAPSECTCPKGQVCVIELSEPGPSSQESARRQPSCEPLPKDCDSNRPCDCLRGRMRHCRPSQQIPGACECDSGMR